MYMCGMGVFHMQNSGASKKQVKKRKKKAQIGLDRVTCIFRHVLQSFSPHTTNISPNWNKASGHVMI